MLSIYYEIVNESATLSLIIVVVFYLNATTTTRLSNFGTLLDMNLLLFLYITISVRLGCIQLHLPAGLPDRESDDLIVDVFLHLLQIYQLNLWLCLLHFLHLQLVDRISFLLL